MENKTCMDTQLYPLTFKPLYKNYIWGGRNLEKLGKVLPDGIVAESWEISAHQDGMGIVAEGPFEGRTLKELADEYKEQLLGSLSYSKYKEKFPLLLKFFDANDWLSVQVHPDDEYARIHENDFGKTEMWYIVDAVPGASVLYGLEKKVTRSEFKKVIDEGRISELLKRVPVSPGDILYIPAGTVHAAGKGLLIAEIQQNSNATYRLYDFDRKNPDGTTRPLHIEKALDSINFEKAANTGKTQGLSYKKDDADIRVIIADAHFCVDIIDINGETSLSADGRSFIAYLFYEGEGALTWNKGSMPVKAGKSVLVPANIGSYTIQGRIKALRSYVGDINEDVFKPLLEAGYDKEQIINSVAGLA
ncbi:MAG: class I mannose-6-phosphate isomerase [Clostridiaceae bacterium]|nr:class I mannose-6-phosphate isomerase [Clostridiaceae bacterium]